MARSLREEEDQIQGLLFDRSLRVVSPQSLRLKKFCRSSYALVAIIASACFILTISVSHQPILSKQAKSILLEEVTDTNAEGELVRSTKKFDNASAIFESLDDDADGFVSAEGRPMSYDTFEALSSVDEESETQKNKLDVATIVSEIETAREEAEKKESTEGTVPVEQTESPLHPKYRPAPSTRGVVTELYTYGAPGTSVDGLYNPQAPGGCFPGLRVATEARHLLEGTGMFRVKHDPVPSLLDFAYKHALMDFLPARVGSASDHNITECVHFLGEQPRLKDTPKWDNLWWLNGHMKYPGILRLHESALKNAPALLGSPDNLPPVSPRTASPAPAAPRRLADSFGDVGGGRPYYDLSKAGKVERAALMAHLTFLNYYEDQQIAMDARQIGWTFVARANAATDEGEASGLLGADIGVAVQTTQAGNLVETVNTFTDGFGDHMALFQHKDTLQCVLVFEGSSMTDIKDWLSNLNFFSTDFCGFGQVHRGFRAKLYRMFGGIDFRQTIRRKLDSCTAITVGGHSLGGAQAEMFAACANNPLLHDEPGFMDSRLFSIPKGTPKRLPAWYSDKADGSFLKNRGNGYCVDVQGTVGTSYRSAAILYHCEEPGSSYSIDQKWTFTPDGQIVSELSKKCVDGNVTSGSRLVQRTCHAGTSLTSQSWAMTAEGFMLNKLTGKCADAHMGLHDCPYSNNKWALTSGGLLKEVRRQKCVGTHWSGGVEHLALQSCDSIPDAMRWSLSDSGVLKNTVTGKCAIPAFKVGKESSPTLVVGPCDYADPPVWHHHADGRITNHDSMCLSAKLEKRSTQVRVGADACDRHLRFSGIWAVDPRGFIVNFGSEKETMYKCIELFGKPWHDETKMAEGAELWLDFCEVNTDQKWEITKTGFIKNVLGSQKCLSKIDKVHSPNSVYPTLWIDNCHDPMDEALFAEMKWSKSADGELVNRFSKKCIAWSEDVSKKVADTLEWQVGETPVLPMKCCKDGGEIHKNNRRWVFNEDGTIVSQIDGRCLSYGGPDFALNPPLAAKNCMQGDKSQKWVLVEGGFLRNEANNLCAGNFLNSALPDQMTLVLKNCPDGSHQRWNILETGQIQNQASKECLDAPTKEQQQQIAFYQLTLSKCDAKRPTQLWDKVAAPRLLITADV